MSLASPTLIRQAYYNWEDRRIPNAAYRGTSGVSPSLSAPVNCDDHQSSGDTMVATHNLFHLHWFMLLALIVLSVFV